MTVAINRATILAECLRRQRLAEPLTTPDGYLALFELLQPVSPVHNTRPGDPPRLVHRRMFDDGLETDRLRAQRIIVKGRFLGGSIGYVLSRDLGLYANAFRRPLPLLNEQQQRVFETVQEAGPITPRQFKEETGLLNKQIMPALHRLQEAFLVYEDQVDSDWNRGWYDFAAEWPEVGLNDDQWETAAGQVLLRFLQGHVFATFEQLRDWSQFPARSLTALMAEMEGQNRVVRRTVEGLGDGWLRAEDTSLREHHVAPSVFMLHKADPLVRSHVSELKRRFGKREVLQYLLIDGAFQGAVLGHWRIGPHDVEDILVELPAIERADRRDEILKAVAWGYHLPDSRIRRYDGKAVPGIP